MKMTKNPYLSVFGRHIAATALLLTSACAQARPEPIPAAPAVPEHCESLEVGYDYLDLDPRPARQGSTLRIAPMRRRGVGFHVVPLDCASDWSVSDPSLATLAEDRASLRIAPDAPPGATITIGYRIKDKPVSRSLVVVAKDAFVLTGRRRQRSAEGCDGFAPVGELEFMADGAFTVTFQPFESYNDYWGRYRLDPATGALSLSVTGGNYQPSGLDVEGKASFAEDGALILEGMYLGQPSDRPPPAAGTCRYTFG